MKFLSRLSATAVLFCVSCVGDIGKSPVTRGGENPPVDGTGGDVGTNPRGGAPGNGGSGPVLTPAQCATAAPVLPKSRVWRLTRPQLQNSLQATFGYVPVALDSLPADARLEGFSNSADKLSVAPLAVRYYNAAASEASDQVVSRAAEFLKCPLASLGTGTCLADFVRTYGQKAWRRPLTDAEVNKLTGLYTKVAPAGSDVALKTMVQGMLLSPNFLFRTE